MRILTIAGMFFAAMESRLIKKSSDGWTGWGQIPEKQIVGRLLDNASRKDWVDVANLALILWARKEKKNHVEKV